MDSNRLFTVAYRNTTMPSSRAGVNLVPNFESLDSATEWFLVRFGVSGHLTTKKEFDKMYQQISNQVRQAKCFDPTAMTESPRMNSTGGGYSSSFE